MTRYIYNVRGNAVGFVRGRLIYDMRGRADGQTGGGNHVYRLAGSYVGELFEDMVVERHMGSVENIGNLVDPGDAEPLGNPGNRGSVNCGYPDRFEKLLE